jgi:hypothetical protein
LVSLFHPVVFGGFYYAF